MTTRCSLIRCAGVNGRRQRWPMRSAMGAAWEVGRCISLGTTGVFMKQTRVVEAVREHSLTIFLLVTGAAKRIGRGIALRLASEGARVAIHYDRSEAEARCGAFGHPVGS